MAVTHPGKYTVPNTINHALNCDAYPETVVLEKKFAFLRNDFVAEIMVDFYGDKKRYPLFLYLPGPIIPFPTYLTVQQRQHHSLVAAVTAVLNLALTMDLISSNCS